ncbi:MAG: succinylglutamate desuccinylase/aspartoacylase family protein [Planctomycetota bacterium]
MTTAPSAAPQVGRELGTWDDGRPGPTLLVMAGVHGNEPAGVLAVQRVLVHLQERELPIDGRLVALAGNLGALAVGQRFRARDLNRGWGEAAIAAMAARRDAQRSPEDHEQQELRARFEQVLRTASGPVLFVDLHSSSADGAPFLCLADTIHNRRLGLATGVPIILGIEETIDGAALEWFAHRGVAALAAEGGRHQHPDTVGNHEAMLWILLVRLGLLRADAIDLSPHRAHLQRTTAGVPKIVEIVHRHAITAADQFRMAEGFVNFAEAKKGTLLAHDVRGEIRAPYDCRVLLPLYQALGDDGYFLARPVRPFWLALARWLRALRFDALLPFLPGVHRDPGDRDTLLADRRVARWFTVEIFHLLGFRRERPRGDRIAFSRRRSRPENRRL